MELSAGQPVRFRHGMQVFSQIMLRPEIQDMDGKLGKKRNAFSLSVHLRRNRGDTPRGLPVSNLPFVIRAGF